MAWQAGELRCTKILGTVPTGSMDNGATVLAANTLSTVASRNALVDERKKKVGRKKVPTGEPH